MASILIQANTTEAEKSLKNLQTNIEELQKAASQTKIEIKTDGIEKLTKKQSEAIKQMTDYANAQARLAESNANAQKSESELAKSVSDATAELEKSRKALQESTEQQKKLTQATEESNQIQSKSKDAINDTGDAIDKADKKMQGFVSTFVKSAVIYQAIYAIRGAFMDALDTMKEVDSQLVTVRKVTQASVQEINSLRDKAYATASKYGVGAGDYLESVAEFARAGYKGQSDALAELSTKTQIVGDTTAEVANQFLLSMDAAYQYEGSIEKLTKVLDGANEIDNNYATSIQKIAEGLGLIAPIASQVHVSEQELTSAIGTITAVTQRSGSEAARALRALFLNIIGDTTTEIEDGVTATEESVSSLRSLLKQYAPDAVAAAEATGQIIDPMEAIGALSKAMEDGLLTEQELMEKLSSLGGKLRTSQLTALVSNWDMYQNMMNTYADSVGSADREVENALDSWERKTAILANTWTEFIQGSIDTSFIKGFIDGLTQVIKLFGNLGNALVTVGGIFAAIKLPALAESFGNLKTKVSEFGKSLGSSFGGLQRAQLGIAGITAAITVLTMAYNAHRQAVEADIQQTAEVANQNREETESLVKLYGEYNTAKTAYENGTGTKEAYKAATKDLVNALGEEAKAMGTTEEALASLTEKEIAEARASSELALQKMVNDMDITRMGFADTVVSGAQVGFGMSMNALNGQGSGIEQMQNLLKSFPELFDLAGKSADDYARTVVDAYDKANKMQSEIADAIKDGSEKTKEQTDEWNAAQSVIDRYSDKIDGLREQLGNLDYYDGINLTEAFESAADAADDAEESAKIAASAYRDIASAAADAQGALQEFADATTEEVNDAFSSYADIYQKFLADWEAGLRGSNTVKAAIDALLPEEAVNELRAKGVDVGELLYNDFYKGIFEAKGDDYGANLAWMLWDNDTIGQIEDGAKVIKDSVGDVVATITESNGELSVSVTDFDKLAQTMYEITGIPLDADVWKSWMAALGAYSEEIDYTVDDLNNLAEAVGAVNEAGQIDLEKIVTGQLEAGESADKVWDLVDALLDANQNGEVELSTDAESVDEAREKVKNLIDEYLKTHGSDGDVEAHTDEAEEDVDKLTVSVEELTDHEWVVKITGDTSGADAAISALRSSLSTVATAIGNTINSARRAFAAAQVPANMATMASGGINEAGGLTLVNELGPEVIQEGASARIAGSGKPTVTWLRPGATVYTASETKQMLGGVDPSELYDGINAYGGEARGIRRYTGGSSAAASTSASTAASTPTASSSSAAGGSYSGGSSSSSASSARTTSTAASSSSSSTSEKDEHLENLKTVVQWREAELNLLKAQNATTEQQIAHTVKIRDAVKEELEYLKATGGDYKEIIDLTTQLYKLDQDMLELQKEAQETRKKELSDATALKESELRIIQALDGSYADQISKIEEIIKSVQKEENFLISIKADQKDINDLTEKRINLQKQVNDLRQQEIDDKIQELEDVVTLHESVLTRLNAEGAEYIDQYRTLQDIANALMNQITYMEAVGASQVEINGLYAEWYNVMSEIAALQANMFGSLQTAIGNHINDLEKQRQAELAEVEQKSKALTEQNNAYKQQTQYQEKVLAIQKAQLALQNAMTERTVRYYNAVTGQWEWAANANNVKSATEALENAQKSMSEWRHDAAMSAATAALEAEKDAINEKYDKMIEEWQAVSDSLDPPIETIAEVLQTIADNSFPEMQDAVDDLNKSMENLGIYVDTLRNVVVTADGQPLTYDSGGILTGLGGIKATARNEIVVPPDITEKMLSASAGGTFFDRMNELRYLYGVSAGSLAGRIGNSIGSQHNGDTYTFGNITLSRQQAETTTVAELARLSGNLRLYSSNM